MYVAGILQQVQRSRSQPNITYLLLKRHKTATNRLSDFKLGMGVDRNKGDKVWRGVGRPQVAVHRIIVIFF